MARQWQCSPKLDEALEEMSGWFKNAGELETKAEDAFGPAASLRPLEVTKRPSEAQHGGSLKSPVEAEATGEDVASHIFGTAKAVLEQSRQEFMQLLQSLDGSTETQTEQHPSHAASRLVTSETTSLQRPASPPGSTKSCREEQAPEQLLISPHEKHWKRSLKSKKGRGSAAESPFSPGLVSTCSYAGCLYPKREIVQEKLRESRVEGSNDLCKQVSDDTFFVRADSAMKQKGSTTMPGLASEASTAWRKKDLRRASRSQKEAKRVRIRITPQHFSPLGTMFRDVQVDFFPSSFTIRALDCEGYAWTAYSNQLPGDIDTDQCRFKIDPSGKDVIISLQKAGSQSWQDLTRLELTRPYHLSSPGSLG
ncbi:unnamed protein product [Symbiodinium microadriaticum]|nr:unnamed protein product [Symbiodinium microadriaticum]